jgi:hypothetical protein
LKHSIFFLKGYYKNDKNIHNSLSDGLYSIGILEEDITFIINSIKIKEIFSLQVSKKLSNSCYEINFTSIKEEDFITINCFVLFTRIEEGFFMSKYHLLFNYYQHPSSFFTPYFAKKIIKKIVDNGEILSK